jgi:purine-binding chemotaxis protein CheW
MAMFERMQEKSLGAMLVQNGLLTADKLRHALSEQQRAAEPLGKTLVRLGYVREEDVLRSLQGLLVVIFRLGQEDYAFEALYVQEIIRWHEVNRLPQMPDFVEGLLRHREKIVPVFNLALRLGRTPTPKHDDSRIIIVERASQAYGLEVDGVESVLQLPLERIDNSPTLVQRLDARFLYGVGKFEKRVVTLLNLEAILEAFPRPTSLPTTLPPAPGEAK